MEILIVSSMVGIPVCLRTGRTRLLVVLALFCGWFATMPVAYAADNALEYEVKGAFLVKFGAFVDWPANTFAAADTPFVIGVLGSDPFGPTLDQYIAAQRIHDRPVVLKRLARSDVVQGVHVLFISESERERLPLIFKNLRGKPVLTVAEFSPYDVIIHFIIDHNKVRFEINLDEAERAGLKVSSKLLSVAKTVRGK